MHVNTIGGLQKQVWIRKGEEEGEGEGEGGGGGREEERERERERENRTGISHLESSGGR